MSLSGGVAVAWGSEPQRALAMPFLHVPSVEKQC